MSKYVQGHPHNTVTMYITTFVVEITTHICQCKVAHNGHRGTARSKTSELKHLQSSIAHGQEIDHHERVHLHDILKLQLFSVEEGNMKIVHITIVTPVITLLLP